MFCPFNVASAIKKYINYLLTDSEVMPENIKLRPECIDRAIVSQCGPLALLKRPIAELFLWCEVLVLMDCSLLPEGSD